MKYYIKIFVFIFIPILLFSQHWTDDYNVTNDQVPSFTSLNNARCVAVTSESIIHIVWTQFYGPYQNQYAIYYDRSFDYGQTWSPPDVVGEGSYPSIALSYDGNTPWILYVKRGQEDVFKCAVRRPDGTWKIRDIYACEENERTDDYNVGPSLMMAITNPERNDLGYGVFSDNYDRIFFVAFDTIDTYCQQAIDENDPCLAPSLSITPEDNLHVVWQRNIENGQIFYKEARKVNAEDVRNGRFPEWSREYQISTQDPQTEPASNPSIEAYGEYVYAAWRGPNIDGEFPGDVWRRARWLPYEDPTRWEPPDNQSRTPYNESNYPVMSNNFVTVWQESISEDNWDIWAKFEQEDSAKPIFQTPNSSKYPQIHALLGTPPYFVRAIWTEEFLPSMFAIKYGLYRQFTPETLPPEKGNLYYVVDIGKTEPSPYCLERDGFLTQGTFTLDYGDNNLKYKLPFLNPQYNYTMRAIVYRTGVGNWIEDVYVDSTLTATILSEPYQPETVWINVPKEYYEYDTKIEKEIEKIIGRRALIADLRLYQVESNDSTTTGGGQQSAGYTLIQRPKLYQSYPNPFKLRTAIRYTLPAESKVLLQLFDISGRLVKTLVDQHQVSGNFSIPWDGRDDTERTVAQGIYFYRLKTNRFSETKRILLLR